MAKKVESKSKNYLKRDSLHNIEDFSTKNYISYLKKTGGQVFQFYSLTRDKRYELTNYIETEVVFSREIFKRVTYTSKVYPLFIQDSFASAIQLSTSGTSYFGERLLPTLNEGLNLALGLTQIIIRDVLRIRYMTDSFNSRLALTGVEFRPARVSISIKENISARLSLTSILYKYGIKSSYATDETASVSFAAQITRLWRSSRREFTRSDIRFVSAKDMLTTPSLSVSFLDPFYTLVNKEEMSLSLTSSKSGLLITPRDDSRRTVNQQPYLLTFKFKTPTEPSEGVLMGSDTGLEIGLTPSGLTVNGSDPVPVVLSAPGEWNTFYLEKTPDGNLNLLINETPVQNPSLSSVQDYKIFPYNQGTSFLYLGNSSEKDKAYQTDYKDITYLIGSKEDLEKKEDTLASNLRVENSEVKDEYNTWKGLDSLEVGEDHLVFHGNNFIIPDIREDVSVYKSNNYRVELDFELGGSFTRERDKQVLIDQKYLTRNEGLITNLRVWLSRSPSDPTRAKVNVTINNTTVVLEGDIGFHERVKLDLVKYKRSLYLFLNEELTSPRSFYDKFPDDTLTTFTLGGTGDYDNFSFQGKLYNLRLTNYYTGDDRLVSDVFNKNASVLNFETDLRDSANPLRVWGVEGNKSITPENGVLTYYNSRLAPLKTDSLFSVGEEDFTVEFKIKPTSASFNLLDEPFRLQVSGGYLRFINSNARGDIEPLAPLSDFSKDRVHVSINRKDGTTYVYLNGVLVKTSQALENYPINFSDFYIQSGSELHLDAFRFTKGYALYHTVPYYLTEKGVSQDLLVDSSGDLLTVPEENLLLRLSPSKYSPREDNNFIPKKFNYYVSQHKDSAITAQSDGVEIISETYLEQNCFKLLSEKVYSLQENETLEFVIKDPSSILIDGSPLTEGLKFSFNDQDFYYICINISEGVCNCYVDEVLVKAYSAKTCFLVLPQSKGIYYLIRHVKGEALLPSSVLSYPSDDFNVKVLKDSYALVSENRGTPLTWIQHKVTPVSGTTEISASVPPGEFLLSLKGDAKAFKRLLFNRLSSNITSYPPNVLLSVYRNISDSYREWFSDLSLDLSSSGYRSVWKRAILESTGRSLEASDEAVLKDPSKRIERGSSGPIRNVFSGLSFFEFFFRPGLKFYKNTGERDEDFIINMIGWASPHLENKVNLNQTDSFNKIPYNSPLNPRVLEGSSQVTFDRRSPLERYSYRIPKEVYLESRDIEVSSETLSLSLWVLLEEIKDSVLFTLKGPGYDFKIITQSGNLCLSLSESEVIILPLKLSKEAFYHLKFEFSDRIEVYLGGSVIYSSINPYVPTEGLLTFSINTEDVTRNTSMVIDHLILSTEILGDSFNPLSDLMSLHNDTHFREDLTELLFPSKIDLPSYADYSGGVLSATEPYTMQRYLPLQNYAGIENSAFLLVFKSEALEEYEVRLEVIGKDGRVIKETSQKVLPENKENTIWVQVEEEQEADLIAIHLNIKEGVKISGINASWTEPYYKVRLKEDGSYRPHSLTNKHIPYVLEV